MHAALEVKIAQIAPLPQSVPPHADGGTERVVSYLTEELVRLGHDATLFATADPAFSPSHHALMVERVRQRAHEFDLLHFHVDTLHRPAFRPLARKTLATVHGPVDAAACAALHDEFAELPLVSISNSQRSPVPDARWVGTVYHGLPEAVCPFNPVPPRGAGRYLAFLGRVSPGKGLRRAIEIARRANTRLRIAAKIDPGADEHYWRSEIKPLLSDPLLQFVGEVDEAGKPAFLGNAAALLLPADGPQPFSLAMIEAMSCGTPVIAFDHGPAREIVEPGITGAIVDGVDGAAEAARSIDRLDRARVRARFESRFSAARMTRDYLALYRRLAAAARPAPGAQRGSYAGAR